MLFERPYLALNTAGRNYDVSPDGERFLVLKSSVPPPTDARQLGLRMQGNPAINRWAEPALAGLPEGLIRPAVYGWGTSPTMLRSPL